MEILKYLIVLLIIAFVSCTKKTTIADSRNDSVEKYLKLASIDTLSIEIRKNYNHKAFSFIDLEKNDSVVRWYLSEVSWNSISLNDSTYFYNISKIHYKKSNDSKDSINLARCLRYKGYFLKGIKKIDSSFFYYLNAEKFLKTTKNKLELFKVLYNKGFLLNNCNDFHSANYNTYQALLIIKKIDNNDLKFETLNLLGNIHHNLKEYKEAINYHKEALNLIKKENLKSEKGNSKLGTNLNNIGNSYRELQDYTNAISYFKAALNKRYELKNDPLLKSYLLNNLGYCYLKQNNFKKVPNLLIEAARIFDSCGVKDEAAISRIYLADYYAKIKDTTSAIQYANQAIQLAKESKSSYYYLYTLSNAGLINKKKAPQYISEYHRLNDSLLFEERKARNQYFKIQLETDEIAQQKEKAIKQKWVQTSIIASLLIIVILLFIIYKQRSQKKEFILIQNQQKASEEIYQLMLNQQSKEEEAKQKEKKRIAIELHDNVMNKLASTRFNLFSLTKKSDSQSLKQAVQHIDSIKEVEDEIRNITHELSKETFSKSNSFTTLLTQLINEQNQIHTTLYQLELDDSINWDIISSEIKMNYYRIIQEAIHNCNKYAAAKHSTISLFYEVNQLRLTISDNGKGFDTKIAKQGIGLQNMKQRMESIHGKISINSELGKGTVINCSVEIDVN